MDISDRGERCGQGEWYILISLAPIGMFEGCLEQNAGKLSRTLKVCCWTALPAIGCASTAILCILSLGAIPIPFIGVCLLVLENHTATSVGVCPKGGIDRAVNT